MEKVSIIVDNLKCGGCANRITQSLMKRGGVSQVNVDVDSSVINVTYADEIKKEEILDALLQLGYPEQGEGGTKEKIKSYVSCMVGRIQ